mgnify:CR=1 FL=1
MAFVSEAVMPIEFQVPSLRVQTTERLSESESERQRLEQLLELGEEHITSFFQLEHNQQRWKAFVDRHSRDPTKSFVISQLVL